MTLVNIRDLSVRFGGTEVIKGIDLALHAGELLAVVGQSGCGKTTLCMALLELLDDAAEISFAALEHPPLKKMSLVLQDAKSALDPTMPVLKQVMEESGINASEARSMLEGVGLSALDFGARRYPGALSGGMCQRVALAVAMAADPQVIIADEPTSSLDMELRDETMDLLSDLCRSKGKAVLFVTHDLALARKFADRVLVMQHGTIVEQGSAAAIFADPEHEHTKELIHFGAIDRSRGHTHGRVHYHDAVMHTHEQMDTHAHVAEGGVVCEQRGSRSHTHKGGDLRGSSATTVASKVATEDRPLVVAKGISKTYASRSAQAGPVLQDVDLELYPNIITGMYGPSGIGKSTLARILAGLEKPSRGERICQKDTNIQMIFQDSAAALNPRMSVERIIAEPLYLSSKTRPSRARICELLSEVDLSEELIARRPWQLSGGQRQRVAIARAIASHPQLIIADEPFSSLDTMTSNKIIHLLRRIKDKYALSMLVISHDIHLLAHVSDEIVELTATGTKVGKLVGVFSRSLAL